MLQLTRVVDDACALAVDKSRYITGPHSGKVRLGSKADANKNRWLRVLMQPSRAGQKSWMSRAVCEAVAAGRPTGDGDSFVIIEEAVFAVPIKADRPI